MKAGGENYRPFPFIVKNVGGPMYRFIFILFCINLIGCGPKPEHPIEARYAVFDSSNISLYSTDELLGFLTSSYMKWYYKYNFEAEAEMDWTIVHELAEREDDIPIILSKYEYPQDSLQHLFVTEALYQSKDGRVLKAFKNYPSNDLSRISYLCLDYRAQFGDLEALHVLNDNYFEYPVSSVEWAGTVEHFGKYNYHPAIPNLIASLDAVSLDLGDASYKSLKQLFPGPHPDLKTIRETREYFQRLYQNSR